MIGSNGRLRFPILALQIFAGLLTAYGTFAIISTAGIQPPNIVALLGLVAAAASGLAAARVARNPFASWWPSLAAIAVPLLFVTLPELGQTSCPPDHPPLTATYYCVPPGAPVIFAASALGIALAMWGASRDLHRSYEPRLDRVLRSSGGSAAAAEHRSVRP